MADVLKKDDLKEIKKQLSEGFVTLEARVKLLETGASGNKEGLRSKITKLSGMVYAMSDRLSEVEKIVYDEEEDEVKAAEVECRKAEELTTEVKLQKFRVQLSPHKPVHLGGLVQRSDLNGMAGFLIRWDSGSGRWGIQVGSETISVKPINIYP